ncbi:hypothetical protein CDD81_4800 [Ophiocordyceps australis]|uniref:Alkaline phytoceramidase n=1 Tax=Ophiocordyceps australis TaxID=1399860 RepID=A0A2C5X6Y7_9HYPO|nr:hypothetical protein CDD81_4800 [Ophiocordyceps australis]
MFEYLRVPYAAPVAENGFWGEQTSTLNFCEEDYVISSYCAEMCNTVTNGLFIWLGTRGFRNCINETHAFVFHLAFAGYMVVGLGSIMFHATLKYPMQLVDELSMIYTTCLMMYASFSLSRSKSFCVFLGLSLLALAGSITVYYHKTKDPLFHQATYGALTAIIVFRSMWIMEMQVRPKLESAGRDGACHELKTVWIMVATGLSIFVAGFGVWNVDNVLCDQLRQWRRAMGLPWAIVLEGHAWWHLMTGIGAYYYITWGIWLRHCLDGRHEQFRLRWSRTLLSIPVVESVAKAKSN